jgi:transposase
MSKRTPKRFTSHEEVAILRLHLLEGTPVSDLCAKHALGPSMFYRWQKDFFENGAAALEPRARRATNDKDRPLDPDICLTESEQMSRSGLRP